MIIAISRAMPAGTSCLRAVLRAVVLASAVGLSTSLSAFAADTLNFEHALALARDRSRQLAAQDAAATASREMAVAAGQRPDPTLKVGINNLPVDGSDRFSIGRDFMTMRSIGVMQELTREDKRKARTMRFEREAEVAQAGRDLALANLERDTALAWLERYYQETMRELLVRARDEAKLQIDAAQAAYRSGRGAQADVFAAHSAVAQIEDRIALADQQVASAKIALARWVGDAAQATLGQLPGTETVRLHDADLDTQLNHHPEIAVLAGQEDVALADAQLARTNKRADWSVELMYSQRGSSFSNMVSVNLSVPLQWDQKNRQDRELAAKLALADQAHAQREEMTRAHAAEARTMLQAWHSDRERLPRYDNTLIPLAGERTQAAMTGYRAGTGTLSAVLEARRAEIDTRMERLKLEMETARLWAQLNFLIPIEHGAAAAAPLRSTQ